MLRCSPWVGSVRSQGANRSPGGDGQVSGADLRAGSFASPQPVAGPANGRSRPRLIYEYAVPTADGRYAFGTGSDWSRGLLWSRARASRYTTLRSIRTETRGRPVPRLSRAHHSQDRRGHRAGDLLRLSGRQAGRNRVGRTPSSRRRTARSGSIMRAARSSLKVGLAS